MEIWDANTHFGTLPFKDGDYSLETLLSLMARQGIVRAAAYSLKGVYYDFHEGNEETLAAAAAHPALIPVMTIDPRRHVGCLEEVSLRAEQGCHAFRFFPDLQGWPPDFLPIRPILELLNARGMTAIFPAVAPGQATALHRALADLDLSVMLMDVSYATMAEAIALAQVRGSVFIETHRLVLPGGIDAMAQAVGYERLVFGSGAPEMYPASGLALVESSGLTAGQKQAVLRDNLQRALNLA